MRKTGLFLVVVVLLAVVQETVQQFCSDRHCSGNGRKRRCSCGCRNCCIDRYGCRGGFCLDRFCICFNCRSPGFADSRGDAKSSSKRG